MLTTLTRFLNDDEWWDIADLFIEKEGPNAQVDLVETRVTAVYLSGNLTDYIKPLFS